MRIIKQILVIISVFAVFSAALYAAHGAAPAKKPAAGAEAGESTGDGSEAAAESGGIRLGGDFGKGTNPVMFDDESLVSTPVPTMTPDIKLEKQEKQAWNDIRNTRDLLKRCQTDLVRYEKFMRKEFMSNLNQMQKSISTIHTYALLYKRDEVEYIWGNAASKGEQTLATCEEYANEFNENYEQMIKNQKSVMKLLSKSSSKIQQPGEVRREWEENKKQMFWTKKKIDYFNGLFLDYVAKYNRVIDEKDRLVEKMLSEHKELHKP
jgi:hypothetical protein